MNMRNRIPESPKQTLVRFEKTMPKRYPELWGKFMEAVTPVEIFELVEKHMRPMVNKIVHGAEKEYTNQLLSVFHDTGLITLLYVVAEVRRDILGAIVLMQAIELHTVLEVTFHGMCEDTSEGWTPSGTYRCPSSWAQFQKLVSRKYENTNMWENARGYTLDNSSETNLRTEKQLGFDFGDDPVSLSIRYVDISMHSSFIGGCNPNDVSGDDCVPYGDA